MPAIGQTLILALAAFAVGSWLVAAYSAIRLWRSLPRGRQRWRLVWNGMDWFKAATFPAAAAADRRRLVLAFFMFFAAILGAALVAAIFLPNR